MASTNIGQKINSALSKVFITLKVTMSKILVIGSANTDLITKVDRFPAPGETILGKSFLQAMGGKGANQAVAASRSGGDVMFVTCVGNDANGNDALKYYVQQRLNVSHVRVVESVPTGTAIILVDSHGENCIVVTPGANHLLSPDYIDEIAVQMSTAGLVVLQMEIPYETVTKACEVAAKLNIPVLLNVAPARKVDSQLLKFVNILVVNETEIELIAGQPVVKGSERQVIERVIAMGATTVILTLGASGCIIKSTNLYAVLPAFNVTPIDTTAAGDTFCGALVAKLSMGSDLLDAATFATAAAAICVTRVGAQPAIPTAAEVKQFLADNTAPPIKLDT